MKTKVFFEILISFLRSGLQMVYWHTVNCDYDLMKEIIILVKVLLLLFIMIYNMMRILSVLQVTAGKIVIK